MLGRHLLWHTCHMQRASVPGVRLANSSFLRSLWGVATCLSTCLSNVPQYQACAWPILLFWAACIVVNLSNRYVYEIVFIKLNVPCQTVIYILKDGEAWLVLGMCLKPCWTRQASPCPVSASLVQFAEGLRVVRMACPLLCQIGACGWDGEMERVSLVCQLVLQG